MSNIKWLVYIGGSPHGPPCKYINLNQIFLESFKKQPRNLHFKYKNAPSKILYETISS